MMGHRAGHRDEDWLPKVLVGLSVAASLLNTMRHDRNRRHWERRQRWANRPSGGPLSVLFILLGLFVAFIVALSILGGLLSALGGAGSGGMLCLAPAAILFFAVWAIKKASSASGQTAEHSSRETWTADREQPSQGMTLDDGQTISQPYQEPVRRTTVAPAVTRVPAAAPVVDPYPDKNAVTPSEYRQRAVSYRRRIQSLIKSRRPGPIAARLSGVLESLQSWEERVGQLADRLALYENDDLIRRDLKEVPTRLARLQRLVESEVDPDIRRQMARTLAAYQEQQRQLDLLTRVMRRTRLNLDDTLAAMGTIYSQVQVVNAMDVDGATAERIADEINSEVNRLNDLLSALSEVNQQTVTDAPMPSPARAADTAADPTGEETAEEALAARRARLERSAGK